ncbi:MAG: GH3 auxin-responsive promoter family protein, partial [Alistipes sp.]|nr:GH3 auxin-responsive promoter family protein [Alistipes sp.]
MSLRSKIGKAWFSRRARAIDDFRRHPLETQERMFREALRRGRRTAFGRAYMLETIRTPERFAAAVPAFDYETFKPWIERMRAGERDVAAPGRVDLFARSSGTTSDRSKYIPVTRRSLWYNHT